MRARNIAIIAAAGILWTNFRPREATSPLSAPSLSAEERAALDKSAAAVKELFDKLKTAA